MRALVLIGLVVGLFMNMAHGAESASATTAAIAVPSDKDALSGLKEVKMIFDFNVTDPKKMLDRLELIEQTRDGIARNGLTPKFVVAFRGISSRYTQKDASLFKPEDAAIAAKIHDKIVAMSQDSRLDLNQCALANSKQKVKNEDTFTELKLVTNSMITIGAFQNKGYAYVILD